ncbi:unnamed protein product [Cylindrotheca closterium]|uniref:Lecithin-cholesterol acyltransferase n=1 Tax=Cylindrotheca closterium TaxID=2856 RepID=A0AAD2G6Y5_9STRA|nr:unnamed protein product [Cylindrotheca closterium]
MNDTDKPIVFYVPGLYSSTLKPLDMGCFSDNQWNPPRSLIGTLGRGNNGHKGLKLPITWSQKQGDNNGTYIQDKDDVKADDCLYAIQDKLLHFLDTLQENGMIELHKIVWDWRRTFEEAEQHIAKTMDSIMIRSSAATTTTTTQKKKAVLVTHSTGALVAWPTICKHPEYFSCWVNAAGCLLQGSNMFLKNFRYGYSVSNIIRMLSKEVFFTFPGLYSYFPTVNEEFVSGNGKSDWVNDDGTTFYTDIDIHKVETWEEYKLGIFGWKNKGETVTEQERSHLQHCLDAAKRFRETNLVKGGMDPNDASFLDQDINAYDHLKIICYGTDKFQVHSAYQVDVTNKTVDVSSSKLTTNGDGTLFTTNWQTVPGSLKREIVMAQDGSDHVSLVNDIKLQKLLLDCFFANDEIKRASAQALLKL